MNKLSNNLLATLSGFALVIFPQLTIAEGEEEAATTSAAPHGLPTVWPRVFQTLNPDVAAPNADIAELVQNTLQPSDDPAGHTASMENSHARGALFDRLY